MGGKTSGAKTYSLPETHGVFKMLLKARKRAEGTLFGKSWQEQICKTGGQKRLFKTEKKWVSFGGGRKKASSLKRTQNEAGGDT